MPSGVSSSKDYEIQSLEIISSGGQTIDVRNIFTQLQIYQDIFSSVMHGNILINDGMDIFNNFYFCGNEYIRIVIDKPSLDEPIKKTFRVYKATDRKKTGNSGQGYILHFCSDEMILSNSMLVSKAYKNATAADIVRDVLVNELKINQNKLASFDPTSGIYDFIVPNYRPLEAIQWAVARSYDESGKSCYFFFENTRGYNFQSLQTLYKRPIYKKVKYEIKNAEEPDPAVNKDSADNLKIVNDFDLLTSISNGSFASKLLTVDIFSQNFVEYSYSAQKAESEQKLLNPNKPINVLENKNQENALTAFNSCFTTYALINDTKSEKENTINKWLMPRALHMSLVNHFRIKLTLPGDTAMNAGDIVELDFPKFKAADESGKEFDEYRSGKYLVAAVNHKFFEDTFLSIVELCSDSFAEQLPAAIDLTKMIEVT